MGLGDSMKRLIGIEEYDEDEEITDAEVNAAREKLEKKNAKREAREARQAAKDAAKERERDRERPAQPEPRRTITTSKTPERRFSVANTSAFKLVLLEPRSFDECPKLVDSLKTRKPVIVNLEKLETDIARKIFDFLSGATYALNGNVQKVANNIFIFAPENVDIAGGAASAGRSGFDYESGASASSVKPPAGNSWR